MSPAVDLCTDCVVLILYEVSKEPMFVVPGLQLKLCEACERALVEMAVANGVKLCYKCRKEHGVK